MGDFDRVRKLRWLCRRGMKELDILLERFVGNDEALLADGYWPELETLLQNEDDVLWDWLQDTSIPEAIPYRKLLQRIRDGRS